LMEWVGGGGRVLGGGIAIIMLCNLGVG
jgi:hypothetical protein